MYFSEQTHTLKHRIPKNTKMSEIWTTGELRKLKGQLNDNVLDVLVSQKTEISLNKSEFSDESISLWLDLIHSACRGHNADQVIKLLMTVCHSMFFKTCVGVYVSQLQSGNENLRLFTVMKSTIEIMTQISQRFPNSLIGTIGLVEVLSAKANATLTETEDVDLKKKIVTLSDQLNCIRDNFMKHFMDCNEGEKLSVAKRQETGENFRDIPILPRVKDILYDTRNTIRPNKSKGAYENLEHYLDIQFKLYREDYISPLRESISEYVREWSSGRHIGRLQDGRLYKKVRAIKTHATPQGQQYTVELDFEHAMKILDKNNKRLIYGTLICLSQDNFRSLYFAVVSNREHLEDRFQFDIVSAYGAVVPFDVDLTMIESSAYFEAYRHVLKSLQQINEGDLPFERYIVTCCADILPPKYLINREKEPVYDLSPIGNQCKIWDRPPCKPEVDILSSTNWPTQDRLHMNTSQFEAYKAALTKEFVLIQGPPGTGKTHVALQIAKTLLHNQHIWDKDKLGTWNEGQQKKYQLLIVCFTNHALDQFVEGIVNFIEEDSPKLSTELIRVGGRSQNENIRRFSLNNKRHRHPLRYRNQSDFLQEAEDICYSILVKRWQIEHCHEYVVCLQYLSVFISKEHMHFFGYDQQLRNERFLAWLGLTPINLLRKAVENQSKFSGNDHQMQYSMEDLFVKQNEIIEVETAVEQAEDDNRIEDDVLPNDFVIQNLGLKIAEAGNCLLRSDEYDITFKWFLKAEIEKTIAYLRNAKPISKQEADKILKKDLKKLPLERRWRLYKYWQMLFMHSKKEQIVKLENHYADLDRLSQAAKMEIDKDIMGKATVIAMTTSGAARYQSVLCDIGPRIVIVEEAAEVLEAHIIASLSPQCQHLILIGDHKQLEPKPSVYELAIKYNLGLSMFERMLNNGLEFHCLERQHRMRPDISQLLQGIYPNLVDNENVMEYPHVGGVRKDVFFISHSHKEDFRDDMRSYSNDHEAEFVKHLCNYLLLQGYSRTQIAILTAYSGQMFLLQEKMPKSEYEGVRICPVDNFQGEENDIILLSLVRSNTAGKIGFLNRENRICVALSRAKIGLYVIGDFSMLSKSSSNWKKVIEIAHTSQYIGHKLPLYCQNHPDTELMAEYGNDFRKAPQGGCEKDCDFKLECGHACRLKCHPKDASHKEYKCIEPCVCVCRNGHVCYKHCHKEEFKCLEPCMRVCMNGHICYEKCHKDESKIQTMIKATRKDVKHILPLNHLRRWRLTGRSLDNSTVCFGRFACGHICKRDHLRLNATRFVSTCTETDHRCTICNREQYDTNRWEDEKWEIEFCKCNVKMEKHLKCNHSAHLPCFVNADFHECQTIAQRKFDCGHDIDIACHVDINKIHCEISVTRMLPRCGHEAVMDCWENPNDYKCTQLVNRTLSCDHTLEMECHENPNLKRCDVVVSKELACGHGPVDLECNKNPNVKRCDVVVSKGLTCDHGPVDLKCFFPVEKYECKVVISKTVIFCGHENEMECYKNPLYERCEEKVKVEREDREKCDHTYTMSCTDSKSRHRRNIFEKNNECTDLISIKLKCGHDKTVQCYLSKVHNDCSFPVEKNMPNCEHTMMAECHVDVSSEECMTSVLRKIPICNHDQEMRCHENPETFLCNEKVTKEFPNCNHPTEMRCFENPEQMSCQLMVVQTIPGCGHKMNMRCSDIPDSCLCQQTVIKQLPDCGHSMEMPCFRNPQELQNQCEEIVLKERIHCGHRTEMSCGSKPEDLLSKCLEKVTVGFPCGHSKHSICHQQKSLRCTEIYSENQPCGHTFSELCDNNFGSYKMIYCKERCNKQQICGHLCASDQCNLCQPCEKMCENSCPHGRCSKTCFQQCDRCDNPCTWECEHFKCTNTCSEICDRPRCEASCNLSLKCGHQCPGLCGEPCPPRCTKCTGIKQKLPIAENELMVYLECGHLHQISVLDKHVDNLGPLSLPLCPDCRKTIHYHPRYGNIIKEKQCRIDEIKRRIASVIRSDKNKENAFPVSNKQLIQQCVYVTQFRTFINVQKQIYSLAEELQTKMADASSFVNEMKENVENCPSVFVCSMKFYMYKLAAMWLACLGSIHIYTTLRKRDDDDDDSFDEQETKFNNDDFENDMCGSSTSSEPKADDIRRNSDIVDVAWRILSTMKTIDHETLMFIYHSLEPLLEQNTLLKRILDVPVQYEIVDIHIVEQFGE